MVCLLPLAFGGRWAGDGPRRIAPVHLRLFGSEWVRRKPTKPSCCDATVVARRVSDEVFRRICTKPV